MGACELAARDGARVRRITPRTHQPLVGKSQLGAFARVLLQRVALVSAFLRCCDATLEGDALTLR